MIPLILCALIMGSASSLFAHANESGAAARVGPDKGVLEVDDHEGFVLRPSAEKNFAIQKTQLKNGPVWNVPASSLVYSGLETQVMRERGGHWKSVDVEVVRKLGGRLDIRSKDLLAGDLLAIGGIGFLKIIEQSVMAPHADSHGDTHAD